MNLTGIRARLEMQLGTAVASWIGVGLEVGTRNERRYCFPSIVKPEGPTLTIFLAAGFEVVRFFSED